MSLILVFHSLLMKMKSTFKRIGYHETKLLDEFSNEIIVKYYNDAQ